MRNKIESGEIESSTLTYKEGATDWLPLERQCIWIDAQVKKKLPEESDKDWILLVQSEIDGGKKELLQKGPYAEPEIRKLISDGEVDLKDYCWRPGMSDWKRLEATLELSLTRKSPIKFEDGNKVSDFGLEPLKPVLPGLEFENQDVSIPTSIEAKDQDLQEAKEKDLFLEVPETTEPFGKEELPSIPAGPLFSSKAVLGFAFFLFFGGFLFGFLNPERLPSGLRYQTGSFGQASWSKIGRIFGAPKAAQVSYVFITQLVSQPNLLVVKSDSRPDQKLRVGVFDEKTRKLVPTKKGRKIIEIKTNTFGEAYLNLKQFDIHPGTEYRIKAKLGKLQAEKVVTLSQDASF